jgi:hypothetical protein
MNPLLKRKSATDAGGKPEISDVQRVVKFIKQRGPVMAAQLAIAFGWTTEQADILLHMLHDEDVLGIKHMRFYLKQASVLRFRSKLLYRKSKPVSIFQMQNEEVKEAGPQGDDISQRSRGDYPRLRRS